MDETKGLWIPGNRRRGGDMSDDEDLKRGGDAGAVKACHGVRSVSLVFAVSLTEKVRTDVRAREILKDAEFENQATR